MNFLDKDDFLILMCHCEQRAIGFDYLHILTEMERMKLYSVGIRTAHEQPAWSMIEPAQGQYNWGYLDKIIDRNRNAGLKSLLQIAGWRLPSWIPNEWRAKQKSGFFEPEMLSIWNEEAQNYSDNYYRLLIDRYKSQKDVYFFFGEFQGGEGTMPPSHCYFDDEALKSFRNFCGDSNALPDLVIGTPTDDWFHFSVLQHYIRKGKIFYDAYGEIWNAQQRLMDRWNRSYGNHNQPEIMHTYRTMFPDVNLVLLQYTYFDDAHTQDERDWVDNIVALSKCEVIVEAMFCTGLEKTTPASIAKGFRGQIVHVANGVHQKSLEDWEVEAIKKSYELWKNSL